MGKEADSRDATKGLLSFIFTLYRGADTDFYRRFKSSAAEAEKCMTQFGLSHEQKKAVYKAGLDPWDPPNNKNMRLKADLPSMRALTDLIAVELSDPGEFREYW